MSDYPRKFNTLNNRAFGKCPTCGAKCSIQRQRVSRDKGQTFIEQTIYQCWANRRDRCKATIHEEPESKKFSEGA